MALDEVESCLWRNGTGMGIVFCLESSFGGDPGDEVIVDVVVRARMFDLTLPGAELLVVGGKFIFGMMVDVGDGGAGMGSAGDEGNEGVR